MIPLGRRGFARDEIYPDTLHSAWNIAGWLVVLTILKNVSQWEGLSHILWKIKKGLKPPTKLVFMSGMLSRGTCRSTHWSSENLGESSGIVSEFQINITRWSIDSYSRYMGYSGIAILDPFGGIPHVSHETWPLTYIVWSNSWYTSPATVLGITGIVVVSTGDFPPR